MTSQIMTIRGYREIGEPLEDTRPSSALEIRTARGLRPVQRLNFVSQKFVSFMARLNKDDLTSIRDLMKAGKVTPVIDRRYRLSEVSEALRYLEEGHAQGKVVIILEHNNKT